MNEKIIIDTHQKYNSHSQMKKGYDDCRVKMKLYTHLLTIM